MVSKYSYFEKIPSVYRDIVYPADPDLVSIETKGKVNENKKETIWETIQLPDAVSPLPTSPIIIKTKSQ